MFYQENNTLYGFTVSPNYSNEFLCFPLHLIEVFPLAADSFIGQKGVNFGNGKLFFCGFCLNVYLKLIILISEKEKNVHCNHI